MIKKINVGKDCVFLIKFNIFLFYEFEFDVYKYKSNCKIFFQVLTLL